MRRRPIEPADVPAILAFLAALSEELGSEAVGERKSIGLGHRPRGWLVEDDGAIVGVAPAVDHGVWRTFEVATRSEPVADALVEATHDSAGGLGLRAWSLGGRFGDVIENAGFTPERSLHRLVLTLPVAGEPPAGLAVRGYREGDAAGWVALNNRAFAGHPEQGDLTLEDFVERTELPWWHPEDLRLGFHDGELVGFCWTKRHDGGRGEIYAIAVDPDRSGKGWGKAILVEGLAHLYDVGCGKAILYVDAGNEAAVALYLGMGFRREHTDYAWVVQPNRR